MSTQEWRGWLGGRFHRVDVRPIKPGQNYIIRCGLVFHPYDLGGPNHQMPGVAPEHACKKCESYKP